MAKPEPEHTPAFVQLHGFANAPGVADRAVGTDVLIALISRVIGPREEEEIPVPSIPHVHQRHVFGRPGIQPVEIFGRLDGPLFDVANDVLGRDGRLQSEGGQPLADRQHHLAPHPHVEPDVRVVLALELRWREQPLARDVGGDGRGQSLLLQPFQHLSHRPLEVEPVVEDQVGVRHARDVALARLVEVGVHARPHQRAHLDPVAPDAAGRIGDHPRGGDDPDGPGCDVTPVRASRRAAREERCRQEAISKYSIHNHLPQWVLVLAFAN